MASGPGSDTTESWTLKGPTNHENVAAESSRGDEKFTLTQPFRTGVRTLCGGELAGI